MKTSSTKSTPKGFTLVELLVVIAIIAVLAALAFPAIQGVIRSAKVTESEKVANDIIFSIDAFKSDYDYLPYTGSSPAADTKYTTDTGSFLEVLMGIEEDVNTNKKEYFSADQAKNGLNGLVYTGDNPSALLDSFGNNFEILVDYDLDGKLEPSDINARLSDQETIRSKSAIIATPGANLDWEPTNEKWKDSWGVKSW